MAYDTSSRIAIIGGGCWGLSTAYHLERAGYTDVTVFERSAELPSQQSAANDLNKIVRAQYAEDFYTDLGLEAIAAWKTDDWAPYFHQTGHLVMLSGYAEEKATGIFESAAKYAQAHKVLSPHVTPLDGSEAMRQYCWQLTGPLTNFRGYFNRAEGYAHSANAVKGIGAKLQKRGVRFVLGPDKGLVVGLLYAGDGVRCTGVKTQDGTTHSFDLVICALGAYGASLVPKLGGFNVARCWSVAHIQLTEEECDTLRGIPVVNAMDLGFFFEPDPATRLLKLTPLGAGYSNFEGTTLKNTSLPPLASGDVAQNEALVGFVPETDEKQMRRLLRETLPWLADRPFVQKKMCWFSDTVDSEYCIDFVPNTERSLIVLSGDSGHGFKMMPIFGKWVRDLLEEGRQAQPRWAWRNVDPAKSGADWGGDVSWRFGEAAETSTIVKEKTTRENL
ncbi:hypothetical protein SEUCBS139899_005388 [Sporothrix eucalyptigena]|uniref:FAD dependent oxidoreductase domain-containing protein n=1 Tax=Sporothrix eucalyptigena TaxID=1812306 RepID=A0ABP0CXW4_9PEZI